MAMSREDIDNRIADILVEHGPDGHCDGHKQLTDFVLSLVPRCDQCKWWGCKYQPIDDRHGCGRTAIVGWSATLTDRESLTRCESEDSAVLMTTADFGCVQWEAKGLD